MRQVTGTPSRVPATRAEAARFASEHAPPRNNLPLQLTSFVGREREVRIDGNS